jgi:hypothetical protein
VNVKVFDEWDMNTDLFVVMSNLKLKLTEMIGGILYMDGLVMDMMSSDEKVAARARELFGRKIFKGGQSEDVDEWKDFADKNKEQMDLIFKNMETIEKNIRLDDSEAALQGNVVLNVLTNN